MKEVLHHHPILSSEGRDSNGDLPEGQPLWDGERMGDDPSLDESIEKGDPANSGGNLVDSGPNVAVISANSREESK
jgi:hypothetical protein